MIKVQRVRPKRTCSKIYANYQSYKKYLRDDFNQRCGYCDAADHHSGGVRTYQIDHFAPKKQFPTLKNDYSNLVYSCFYCNNGKSNHWPSTYSNVTVVSDKGFIDPCSDEYDDHLSRNKKGKIVAKTNLGKYMYKQLNMHLMRHSLLYMIDELHLLHKQLKAALDRMSKSDAAFEKVKEKHYMVMDEYLAYVDKYKGTL